ncbi:MAG TPA: flagellar basal body L-ring protein FlgH [Novosphingobium sp.]
MKPAAYFCIVASMLALDVPAGADDLYRSGTFSALASDRTAAAVGDLLTVVVYENATATNSASTSTKKNNNVAGRFAAGSGGLDESAGLSFGGNSDNVGSITRSGKMVAQIGAAVEEVLPNGDLRISGDQELFVAGERTHIRLKGRVRRADISAYNTVLSNRIADARIEYNGKGFASRGAKPGIISRVFNFLGLM